MSALATTTLLGAAAVWHPANAATDPALPRRVLDTRDGSGPLRRGEVRRLDVPAELRGRSSAVALNLTADRAAAPGWVSAWSCDDPQPSTSILNVVPGHPVANMVALDAAGGVCFTASTRVDLIVDVTQAFGRSDFTGVAPERVLDTRDGGQPLPARQEHAVELAGRAGRPGGAAGAALNLTVVAGGHPGWVSVAPCGAPAGTSTANFAAGETVPHFTFSRLSGSRVCITASTPVHVVVDAFGWLPAGTNLTPIDPSRMLDTRNGIGGTRGAVASGRTVKVRVAGYDGVPNEAAGATVNVVAVGSGAVGHVTAWPCDTALPTVSTLNVWPGATRANQATLGLSANGELCLRPFLADGSAIHLVVDAVGAVTGQVSRPEPPPTTEPPTSNPPTTTPPTTSPPTGGGRFTTLPPGSALPSGAECAGRVRPAPEVRPGNAAANSTRGSGPNDVYPRVDGDFVGTTDEIIQWVACKWGIDEDMVRAQIVKESYWHQAAVGDNGESYGLGQVRRPYHASAFEDENAVRSSAYNLDYTYAVWRSCFEGEVTWLNDVDRGAQYAAGDAWGCMGVWFSGRWYTTDAVSYIEGGGIVGDGVKHHLQARTWEDPGFIAHRF